MNQCWDDGGLRAYLDRELSAEDLARVASHLGSCPECHARYNRIAARAARVLLAMGALDVSETAPVAQPRPAAANGWVRPAAAAAMALAAAAAIAFLAIPKSAAPPRSPTPPRVERVNRPIQAETGSPARTAGAGVRTVKAAAPLSMRAARLPSKREAPAPGTDYYLALDDDPIDVGVVMRVALDGAAGAQADVIFDAEGRARAIRPVEQNGNGKGGN